VTRESWTLDGHRVAVGAALMFTGLVTDVGVVRAIDHSVAPGLGLEIGCAFPDLVPGESVAVDGACLTVERVTPEGFAVHVVGTTAERTRLGSAAVGRRVNLERALRVGDRLGGHMVQGHVDGVGEVLAAGPHGEAWLMTLRVPESVWQVSIPLGSITIDGVSLTVHALPRPREVQVSLIPFTLQHTTLGERQAGDLVHVEGDVIGKYVAGQLPASRQPS
jgi:riboflavin synthase